jgi:hypothetical protein
VLSRCRVRAGVAGDPNAQWPHPAVEQAGHGDEEGELGTTVMPPSANFDGRRANDVVRSAGHDGHVIR